MNDWNTALQKHYEQKGYSPLEAQGKAQSTRDAVEAVQAKYSISSKKMSRLSMSIVVVSYARDYPWLEFLFRSVARYCNGFHELVLAVPEHEIEALEKLFPCLTPGVDGAKALGFEFPIHTYIFDERPYADSHMAAMEARCSADMMTSADIVLHCDSDCCFIKETTPSLFLNQNNHVINLNRPFKVVNGKMWPTHWGASTEKALGESVTHECMARHPSCHWVDTFADFRAHIEKVHGKSLHEYLRPLKRGEFSEFCALGSFAMKYEPGYYWIDADSQERKSSDVIHQFFSFHTVNHPDVQAKLKEFGLMELKQKDLCL